MFRGPVLTYSQTQKLQQHTYNSVSNSFVDAYMQRWWNFVVSFIPLWVAPNLITIVGLAVNVATSLVHLYYCPTATESVAWWIPLCCAIGLFMYQTLDAIDGKQARRTGSSNALGELFDHGCDSLSTVFVSIMGACTMGLGHLPYLMMYQSISAVVMFYVAHWQTYVTGQMRFGKFDVTEAQLCMVTVLMCTAFFGSGFWDINFLGLLPIRWVPLVFASIVAIFTLPSTVNNILFNGAGRNGSSVAGTSVIGPVMPLLLAIGPGIYVATNSNEFVYETSPILYNLMFGLIGAKISNKLIVAQMTKSELEMLDSSFLAPALLFAKQCLGLNFPERRLLWLCTAFVVVDLLWYCCKVCLEICDATGWYLFKINCETGESSRRNR